MISSLAYPSTLQMKKGCLFLDLNFDPEDGGYVFLQNVELFPNYMALH
jgi:hypothetical protein